jgi:hypothetical protein
VPAFSAIRPSRDDKGFPVDIRLDLAPDRALRSAARTEELLDLNAMFFRDLQVVIHGKCATFHNSAQHISPGGAVRQPEEYASRQAAPKGRSFTRL